MPSDDRYTGHRPISCNRALVIDALSLVRRDVLFPVERSFALRELADLRSGATRRVSWTVLFMKAYAVVAARTPALRQWYLSYPWPRLFEHAENEAMLVVNREFLGEERICWARFPRPERQTLVELQERLDEYQSQPVESVFRRQVRLSRWPWPVRKLLWWINLNFAGPKRGKRLGTFSMSSLAGQGTINRYHQTVLTSSLTYGPLDDRGNALVTLICDHRVLDGALAARVLANLQEALCGPVADELRGMQRLRAAA